MADRSALLRDAGPVTPGQLLGLPGLLRAWRAVAGEKRNLGRALSQLEVAEAIGRSRAWYQALERGARPKSLDRRLLDTLADVLRLEPDERQALLLSAIDGTISVVPSAGDREVRQHLQRLLDHQLPNAAYLTDRVWNITGYNAAMAALWPWVCEPGANLMRWALLSDEARTQYVDWTHHGAEYIKLLRFASTRYPHDAELLHLITEVKNDPVSGKLWETDTASVAETRDGHRHLMILPAMGYRPVEVVAHLLYPASMPHYRAAVITWASEEDDLSARSDILDAGAPTQQRPSTEQRTPIMYPTPGSSASHWLVATGAEAVEMAGPGARRLPALSSVVGAADCELVINPTKRTVIWATRRADGRWDVSELAAYAVLLRLPPEVVTEGREDVRTDYKELVRMALPEDPEQAAQRCDERLAEIRGRMDALREVRRDLWEHHPQEVPYAWHPVDEI